MKNLIPRHISPHSSNFNTRQICTFDIITFDSDDRFLSSRGYRAIYHARRQRQSLMRIHSVDREITRLNPFTSLGSGGLIVAALGSFVVLGVKSFVMEWWLTMCGWGWHLNDIICVLEVMLMSTIDHSRPLSSSRDQRRDFALFWGAAHACITPHTHVL